MPLILTPQEIVEHIKRLSPKELQELKTLLRERGVWRDGLVREPAATYATSSPTEGTVTCEETAGTSLTEDGEERLRRLEEEFHEAFPGLPISSDLLSMVGICRLPGETDEDLEDDDRLIEEAILRKYLNEPTE